MTINTVLTLGPEEQNPPQVLEETIRRKLLTKLRGNCSHTVTEDDYDKLGKRIGMVREFASKHGHPVSIFIDAPGHKIRLTGYDNPIPILPGGIVNFSDEVGPSCLACSHEGYLDLAKIGDKIYIGDGDQRLTVIAKRPGFLECQVDFGEKLMPRKGLTIQGAHVSSLKLPALAKADLRAIQAGVELNADYLGMSYGTHAWQFAEFITEAKRQGASPDMKYVFKYELGEALGDLDAIVAIADAMYFGHGDLGLSVSYRELSEHRRRVIEACRKAGKECWVGTGLLLSMLRGRRPAPGEYEGLKSLAKSGVTDLVLSEEYAMAVDPVESAEVLNAAISDAAVEVTM